MRLLGVGDRDHLAVVVRREAVADRLEDLQPHAPAHAPHDPGAHDAAPLGDERPAGQVALHDRAGQRAAARPGALAVHGETAPGASALPIAVAPVATGGGARARAPPPRRRRARARRDRRRRGGHREQRRGAPRGGRIRSSAARSSSAVAPGGARPKPVTTRAAVLPDEDVALRQRAVDGALERLLDLREPAPPVACRSGRELCQGPGAGHEARRHVGPGGLLHDREEGNHARPVRPGGGAERRARLQPAHGHAPCERGLERLPHVVPEPPVQTEARDALSR